MTVHIDTSALVDALTGPRRSLPRLVGIVEAGNRVAISSLVFYEWLRGPRTRAELAAQEDVLPAEDAMAMGPAEARLAAAVYAKVKRPRGREIDIAIALVCYQRRSDVMDAESGRFRRYSRTEDSVATRSSRASPAPGRACRWASH